MIARNIAVVLSGRDAGLARTLGAAAGAVHAFDSAVQGANRRSAALAAGLKIGLAALAVALAVGLGAAVTQAVKFEAAMRNVNTVAHATEPELQAISEAVLRMSTELPQSATTLAEGLRNIAGSGFYGADALNILEVSAKAASAGITDTNTAAKAVVAVLNAYGLEASAAADVSDILFQTVELGVLTFEDLALQLGDVVAAAASAGVPIDEVGAAIATMTLSGLSAAEATVSLNRLLRELVDPSDALSNVFRNLGHESGIAALEQDGLRGVMEQLRVVTGGSVVELQKLFPEIRAGRAAFALTAAAGQTYARVHGQITSETERAGATQDAFNQQMRALSNQFTVFKNQIVAVGIGIGTSLIPHLRSALEWAQKVGPQVGEFFTNAWRAAQPAVTAVGDAVNEVTRALGVLLDVAGPVVATMAQFTFAAAIGGLMALANAIEMVAGFLADHPGLVAAVAAAYGAVLVSRILVLASAFIKARAAAIVFAGAVKGAIAMDVIAAAIGRLRLLGSGIAAIFTMGNLSNLRNFSAAFAGLGGAIKGAIPLIAGAAVVGAFVAVTDAMQDAKQRAQELREEMTRGFDLDTIEGLQGAAFNIRSELRKLDEAWESSAGTSNGFTAALRGTAEILTPLPNTLLDNKEATNELRGALEEIEGELNMRRHDLITLSNTLGISQEAVARFLEELGNYDPSDTATTTDDLADSIRRMQIESANATPAASTFADAVDAVGDPTATATDRVEALSNAIDALIGTMLGVSDAAIAWEQAFDDVAAAVEEHGATLDITSEAGREVASSINDAAKAAIELANAEAEATGSVAAGIDVLRTHRQALVDQMVAVGFSREAAEAYINTLGLTPENIDTLVKLQGAEEAMFSVQQYEALLAAVDDAVATGRVALDSSDFDGDAEKIGITLAQIGMANPEATVFMDGKPFRATADQVEAWALMWDAESPEAQALMNILDPENKFNTLQELASAWNVMAPEATIKADAGPAYTQIAGAQEALRGWDASSGTSDVRADNSAANASIGDSASRLRAWNASRGTSTVAANNAPATNAISTSAARLAAWNNSRGDATIGAEDTASGRIAAVANALRQLDGSTATITIAANTTAAANALARAPRRYGGIDYAMASGGVLSAFIARQPTVLFGEGPTGSEAYVPRYGNSNRSKSILAEAAGWYGMEMRPRGMGRQGNIQANTSISVMIKARGAIANLDKLVSLMRNEIGAALEDHDRKLTRVIGAH